MELAGYFPRVVGIEKRVSGSTKYAARLARKRRPPLRIEEAHRRPGQPDPVDRPGIFMIHVVEIEGSQGQAFTPEAEPGISTAAAGPLAPAPKKVPASRRTRAATKPAPRPGHRPAAMADFLAEIKALEARKAELEARQARQLPIERVRQPGQPQKPGPRPGMAGPGRSARQCERRGGR